jgi:hypothetical protein
LSLASIQQGNSTALGLLSLLQTAKHPPCTNQNLEVNGTDGTCFQSSFSFIHSAQAWDFETAELVY